MIARIAWVLLPLVVLAGCESPKKPASAAAGPKVKIRETIGKTTQDVLKLNDALAQKGVLAATNVTSKDYLGAISDVYKTSVPKIVIATIQPLMVQFNLDNNRDPNYDEFMAQIIKAYNVQLPQLPYYQEYAYDETEHKLVVVEFPDKKTQLKKQEDAER
jgi:hypothetical protein